MARLPDWQIQEMLRHFDEGKLSNAKISKELKLARRTIDKHHRTYDLFGTPYVMGLSRMGRNRTLLPIHEERVAEYLAKRPNALNKEISELLCRDFGVDTSRVTISRTLQRIGLRKPGGPRKSKKQKLAEQRAMEEVESQAQAQAISGHTAGTGEYSYVTGDHVVPQTLEEIQVASQLQQYPVNTIPSSRPLPDEIQSCLDFLVPKEDLEALKNTCLKFYHLFAAAFNARQFAEMRKLGQAVHPAFTAVLLNYPKIETWEAYTRYFVTLASGDRTSCIEPQQAEVTVDLASGKLEVLTTVVELGQPPGVQAARNKFIWLKNDGRWLLCRQEMSRDAGAGRPET